MKRRDVLKAGVAATGGVLATQVGLAAQENERPLTQNAKHAFHLKYAPHFGMFKHSAGDDPLDQLRFAADQGFTAW